jgi:hypothetical protein
LKLCNASILVEEHLLLKIIAFTQRIVYGSDGCGAVGEDTASSSSLPSSSSCPSFIAGTKNEAASEMSPANATDSQSPRQCYFGTLQLEIGNISLSGEIFSVK